MNCCNVIRIKNSTDIVTEEDKKSAARLLVQQICLSRKDNTVVQQNY